MINRYYWIPQVGAVAVFANVGGADVIQRLAGRSDAIMAITATLGSNILVVKVGGYPTSGTVAIITLRGGWQVI